MGGRLWKHLRQASKRRRKRYNAYDSRGRLAGKRLIRLALAIGPRVKGTRIFQQSLAKAKLARSNLRVRFPKLGKPIPKRFDSGDMVYGPSAGGSWTSVTRAKADAS